MFLSNTFLKGKVLVNFYQCFQFKKSTRKKQIIIRSKRNCQIRVKNKMHDMKEYKYKLKLKKKLCIILLLIVLLKSLRSTFQPLEYPQVWHFRTRRPHALSQIHKLPRFTIITKELQIYTYIKVTGRYHFVIFIIIFFFQSSFFIFIFVFFLPQHFYFCYYLKKRKKKRRFFFLKSGTPRRKRTSIIS